MASMVQTGGNTKTAQEDVCLAGHMIRVPRMTLINRWNKLKLKMEEEDGDLEEEVTNRDDIAMFDRKETSVSSKSNPGRGRASLTSKATRDLLQNIAVARDANNNGMGRKEMITFISEIENVKIKTADNHYGYLVRTNQLPKLKRSGRVMAAQPTTTNRTAITTEKLLRTYNTMTLGETCL